jgi:formylmethanofuran dehydrogenase subunit D
MLEINMTDEMLKAIADILKRGDTVELKREHGKLVIVEIRRKVKIKEQ